MNWPAGLIDRMNRLSAIHNVMNEYRKVEQPKIRNMLEQHGEEVVKIVTEILRMKHGSPGKTANNH